MRRLLTPFAALVLLAGCSRCDAPTPASEPAAPEVAHERAPLTPEKPLLRLASFPIWRLPPHVLVAMQRGDLGRALAGRYDVRSAQSAGVSGLAEEMNEGHFEGLSLFTGVMTDLFCGVGGQGTVSGWTVVASLSNGPGGNLVARQGVGDVSELDGRTVGVLEGDWSGATVVAGTLREHGLDLVEHGGSVKLRFLPSEAYARGLDAGGIDALLTRGDRTLQGAHLLLPWDRMAYRGAPLAVFLVQRRLLEQDPAAVEEILRSLIEAGEWLTDHPRQAAERLLPEVQPRFPGQGEGRGGKVDLERLTDLYGRERFVVQAPQAFFADVWAMMEEAHPGKAVPLAEAVDFSILERLLAARGARH